MRKNYHDPIEDAKVSMELYRKYCVGTFSIDKAKNKLQRIGKRRNFPDFKVTPSYRVCPGMYNPNNCSCQQKTARGVSDVDELAKLLSQVKIERKHIANKQNIKKSNESKAR
eukprot:261981_1